MKKRLLMSALLLLQGCGGGSGGSGETPPGNQPDPVAGANQPPQISELSLNDANGGEVLSGDTLVLSYRYQDAEGDPEGDSDIRWYRDDQPFTPQDAYQYTVVAADRGHRIGVSVALVAKSGNTTPLAPQLTEVSVPTLQTSELSWQLDPSSHTGVVGDELINPVTTMSRPVQYQSSDPAVAFVNPDGKVRMQQAGRVTISARAAETNQYHAASASYELVIRDNEFVLSGWVGEYATEMNIGAQAQDLNLAVSRGTGCANVVVYGCPGYRVHPMPVGTTQATTEMITLEQGGVIQVETNNGEDRGVINNFDYLDTLRETAAVEFNGKLWLFGGYSQKQASNRVYSSVDGRHWRREYPQQGLYVRPTSDDGEWQSIMAPAAKTFARLVIHNDKVFLIDTTSGSIAHANLNALNQWQTIASPVALPALANTQAISFKNQLWLINGSNSNFGAHIGWIYSSDDGALSWYNRSENRNLPRMNASGFINDQGTLRLFDRRGELSSSDALQWQSNGQPDVHRLIDSQTIVKFNGNWFGLSGNTIQKLSDGIWQPVKQQAFNYGRLVVHQQRLFMVSDNDVLVSNDGDNWQRLAASPAPNRRYYQLLSYDGKLILLMGGHMGGYTNMSEKVYISANGVNWTSHQASGDDITGRKQFAATVHDGYIWMTGGESELYGSGSGSETKNGVWRSDDGIHWDKVASDLPFTERRYHNLVSHNDWLVLLGGSNKNSDILNQVWRSADGKNWQRGFYKNLALTPLQ